MRGNIAGASTVRIAGEGVGGCPVRSVAVCAHKCAAVALEQVEILFVGVAGVEQVGQVDGLRVGVRFGRGFDVKGAPAEADQQGLDEPVHIVQPDAAGTAEHFLQITFHLLHGFYGTGDADAVVAGAKVGEPAVPLLFVDHAKRGDSEMEELVRQFDVSIGQGLSRFQEAALLEMIKGTSCFAARARGAGWKGCVR